MTPSKIWKTVEDTCELLESARRMTQKSGDVIISFRKGPGLSIQPLIPSSMVGAAFSSSPFLKLEIVWSTTGTLMKEWSYRFG